MQELPCYLISGITSTNNNHKCILIEGDTANNIPAKVLIEGFSITSTTFYFYLFGIYNPSVANKYVSMSIKFYDGTILE